MNDYGFGRAQAEYDNQEPPDLGDAPDYEYSKALAWIEREELRQDFAVYVGENFQDIVDLFRVQLHPEQMAKYPDQVDMLGEYHELFDEFIWEVLDAERFEVLLHSFVESNWDSYEEFVS